MPAFKAFMASPGQILSHNFDTLDGLVRQFSGNHSILPEFVLSLLTCLLLLFVLPQLQSRLLLHGYTSEGAARKSKAGLELGELGTVAVAIPTAHVMTPRVLTPLSPLFYQLSPLSMTPYLLQGNYLSISPIKPICTFTEKTLRLPERGRAMRWVILARGKDNKRASVALEVPRNTTAHLLTLFLFLFLFSFSFSFSSSTSNPFVRFSCNVRQPTYSYTRYLFHRST